MIATDERFARAYARAESRALRRFRVALRPGAGDRELTSWTAAERLADTLAARIAALAYAGRHRGARARYYQSVPTMAHRAARLALGMER